MFTYYGRKEDVFLFSKKRNIVFLGLKCCDNSNVYILDINNNLIYYYSPSRRSPGNTLNVLYEEFKKDAKNFLLKRLKNFRKLEQEKIYLNLKSSIVFIGFVPKKDSPIYKVRKDVCQYIVGNKKSKKILIIKTLITEETLIKAYLTFADI